MHRHRPLVLAAALGFALLAAGCGSSSHPQGVANLTSSTTPTTSAQPAPNPGTIQGALVAFSSCVRAEGVAGFPDPQPGTNLKLVIHQQLGTNPRFRAALSACDHLLPPNRGAGGTTQSAAQQRIQVADALSFARCVRSHGVARFPDPTAQGQLSVEMVEAQGIDLRTPAVLRAIDVCLPASHGLLTPAKVRASLDGNG